MSSALTVIVLGHAFFNVSPNTYIVQPNCTEAPSITDIPTTTDMPTTTDIPTTTGMLFTTRIPNASQSPIEPSTPTPDRETRRPGYTYTEGFGAHKLFTDWVNWNTARRTCEQNGSHLVVINSVAEAEAVVQLLKSSNSPSSHVGVHDLYQEGEFVTIFDEAVARTGFNVWREGEPNNLAGNEDCVAIFSHDTKLNDIPCNHQTNFVCEVPYVHWL